MALQPLEDVVEIRETCLIEGVGEFYVDTGEAVSVEDTPEMLRPNVFEDETPVFGDEEADWALQRLSRLDGSLLSTEARLAAEIAALQKNLGPKIERIKKARVRFEEWVKPYLSNYAKRQLDRQNRKQDGTLKANPSKTLSTPYGSLSFTNYNQAGVKLPDGGVEVQRSTLAWVKEHFPHAVVPVYSEKVELANLTKEDQEKLLGFLKGDISPEDAGFDDCPLVAVLPHEKFTVKTGVR